MKIFLSSTAEDLKPWRKVADETILRLSHKAVVMERFGSLPGDPVAECERKARECDVLLCIVAHRYGFVPEKGKTSITRREVEAARSAGKDVLAWIVDERHPWLEKREQDLLVDLAVLADPARVSAVVDGVKALIKFKRWLRTHSICDQFTTPDELGRKIAISLANYINERPWLVLETATIQDKENRVLQEKVVAEQYQVLRSIVSTAYRSRNLIRDFLKMSRQKSYRSLQIEIHDLMHELSILRNSLRGQLTLERAIIPGKVFNIDHELLHSLNAIEVDLMNARTNRKKPKD